MIVTGVYTQNIKLLHDQKTQYLDKIGVEHNFVAIDKFIKETNINSNWRSAYWKASVLYKIRHALNTLNELPNDEILLFSDMDVQPLQHYSILENYLMDYDIVFMDEHTMPIANSGFYLVRKNNKTLEFFKDWLDCCETNEKFNDDQVTLNEIIIDWRKQWNMHKFWGLLPKNIVTRYPNKVTLNTVAVHAIGCIGVNNKIKIMQQAYENFSNLVESYYEYT